MLNKERLFKVYSIIYSTLFVIATVLIILDYFNIIVDIYASTIIFFLCAVNLLRLGVTSFKENDKKKKAWGVFLILLSITWFVVQAFHIFS